MSMQGWVILKILYSGKKIVIHLLWYSTPSPPSYVYTFKSVHTLYTLWYVVSIIIIIHVRIAMASLHFCMGISCIKMRYTYACGWDNVLNMYWLQWHTFINYSRSVILYLITDTFYSKEILVLMRYDPMCYVNVAKPWKSDNASSMPCTIAINY